MAVNIKKHPMKNECDRIVLWLQRNIIVSPVVVAELARKVKSK
jgi:hypothetical protein